EPIDGVGGTVIVEVQAIGTLRMPSGHLVTCDPGWLRSFDQVNPQPDHQPFTVGVAPGEYPVLLSMFRWVRGTGPTAAAAKLVIRDEPVTRWEMGLRPEEDLRILPDQGFFGIAVDGATGCFVDGTALAAMVPLLPELAFWHGMSTELVDRESGANLIAYHS